MKTMRFASIRLLGIAGLLIPSFGATAQEEVNQLTLDLQYMVRGETRNGGLPESNKDDKEEESTDVKDYLDKANFLLGRTRLVADYKRPSLETKMSIQHSGVWGQKGANINVFEAWAKLSTENGLFAQAGRQALSYDDERIIGANDWSMAGMSHDVLRLGYEGQSHKVHAILAYNQNVENINGGSFYKDGSQPYKTMQTLWYHYDMSKIPLGASLLFMNIGMQGGDNEVEGHTEFQQMFGGYLKYAPSQWTAELSYYRQTGIYEKGGIDIDAWMLATKLQYSPTDKYGFVAGYDYMSGDDLFAIPPKGHLGVTQHKVIKGFNPVYGSHHQFYGAMDFFYVTTYVNGFSPGLQNAYVGGHFKPLSNVHLSAKYHYLAIASHLKNMKKTLGHEIEIEASYKFTKDVGLSAGYSFMRGTDTMKKLKRASNRGSLRWGWISLNISPRIFSTKW